MRSVNFQKVVVFIAWVTVATVASTAHAWHESGHRIVARIAWDGLTPGQREFVSALLVRHPRFGEDFVGEMPAAIAGLAEGDPARRRWVFMHAAIWPDIIKERGKELGKQIAAAGEGPGKVELERRLADVKRYDNSTWHYDNEPIYVDPYALPAIPVAAGKRPVGIQLALPAVIKELGDGALAADRRAVALAWVLHLIGDSHQPLHAVALFSSRYLPEGDLGGNRVIVTTPDARGAPTNLHAVWDGMFGADEKAEPVLARRIAAQFPRRKLQAELAVPTEFATVETAVNMWLDESYRAADTSVYDAGIRAAMIAAPPPGTSSPIPLALDRRYLTAAKAVATRRVALAGYRLADCIARAAGAGP